MSTTEDSRGNLNTRPIPIKTMAHTTVRPLASWVPGFATNTGSQTNVRNKETKSQIKTHRLGRDAGFNRCQMRPLSKMLTDTATDTNVSDRRKARTAMVALCTQELCHPLRRLSKPRHCPKLSRSILSVIAIYRQLSLSGSLARRVVELVWDRKSHEIRINKSIGKVPVPAPAFR